MKNAFQEIVDFIYDFGYGEKPLMTGETRIEEDLRITGTDAINLIVSFGRKFNVDVSNFMAADYFEPEGIGLFWRLLASKRNPNKKTLTIKHLVEAVKAGKLDEEIINQSNL